ALTRGFRQRSERHNHGHGERTAGRESFAKSTCGLADPAGCLSRQKSAAGARFARAMELHQSVHAVWKASRVSRRFRKAACGERAKGGGAVRRDGRSKRGSGEIYEG